MVGFKTDKINSFQILNADTSKTILEFGDIKNVTIESEIESSSLTKEILQFNNSASFQGELGDSLFSCNYVGDLTGKPFYLEYYIPIMIQARWHKKPRINKKWLKRYGMKKDKVLVRCDVVSVYTNTECENPYEIEYKFNLDFDSVEYKFRPDQLRKNLRIERCY